MRRLEGKVCVVTGGGGGIGAAIAARVASEGASVVVADIDGDRAGEAAGRIEADGGSATAAQIDVGDRSAVRAVAELAVSKHGKLDVWFNNAGFNEPLQFLDITERNWDRIMRVNALGVLLGTQEAAKIMIRRSTPGKIINTVSIAGRQGFPAFAPYCASKFAVVALTQAGARALAKHNITVNGFAPGVVETPLWDKLDRDLMAIGESQRPGQAMDDFAAGILVGRPARAEEIAGTAAYLASGDADHMTGQIVMIDGGMVLV
jgi:meso-butanediol dehydrogenase / (S,S)-butanediol dehydrogenase / diacetyl reductase